MVNRYPVKQKELKSGAKVEMQQRPNMSETAARRLARQNLQQHPTYYRVMPVAQKIMQDRERRIHPIRKPRPRPQPVTGYSGRIL